MSFLVDSRNRYERPRTIKKKVEDNQRTYIETDIGCKIQDLLSFSDAVGNSKHERWSARISNGDDMVVVKMEELFTIVIPHRLIA